MAARIPTVDEELEKRVAAFSVWPAREERLKKDWLLICVPRNFELANYLATKGVYLDVTGEMVRKRSPSISTALAISDRETGALPQLSQLRKKIAELREEQYNVMRKEHVESLIQRFQIQNALFTFDVALIDEPPRLRDQTTDLKTSIAEAPFWIFELETEIFQRNLRLKAALKEYNRINNIFGAAATFEEREWSSSSSSSSSTTFVDF